MTSHISLKGEKINYKKARVAAISVYGEEGRLYVKLSDDRVEVSTSPASDMKIFEGTIEEFINKLK